MKKRDGGGDDDEDRQVNARGRLARFGKMH
jgi:hypothetical protein